MESKRIGVFGTPCGGTKHLTDCLRASGLDVGHERLKADGIVCGFWVFDDRARIDRAKPRVRDYQWDMLAIAVRHPLMVVETLWQFLDKRDPRPWHVPDPVQNALRYWVHAHEESKRKTSGPIVRVDSHWRTDFEALCETQGIKPQLAGSAPKSKARRKPRPSWAYWRGVDPEYARRGEALVAAYGLDECGT